MKKTETLQQVNKNRKNHVDEAILEKITTEERLRNTLNNWVVDIFEKANNTQNVTIPDRGICERFWYSKPDTFNIIPASQYVEPDQNQGQVIPGNQNNQGQNQL
jgi:hypothetical protein